MTGFSFVKFVFFISCMVEFTRGDEGGLCSSVDGTYTKLFYIEENSPGGTLIGTIGVVGNVTGAGKNIELTLQDNEQSVLCGGVSCVEWLTIVDGKQELSLVIPNGQQLDRDGPNGVTNIIATLLCTDNENKPPMSIAINVVVSDINDNAPVFTQGGQYSISISEEMPVDSHVITVVADDVDRISNRMYYLGQSDMVDYFEISLPLNGEVKLKKKLDFEFQHEAGRTEFDIPVFVEDIGENNRMKTSNAIIHVTVLDADDTPPLFLPCVDIARSCINAVYEAYVTRDAKSGSDVTTIDPSPVKAIDPDTNLPITNDIHYSIFTSDSMQIPYFAINRKNGTLSVVRTLPPKEEVEQHKLFIKAEQSNDESMYSITSLTVHVLTLVSDNFAPQIKATDTEGYVAKSDSGTISFVRTSDGEILRITSHDKDYDNSPYLPPLQYDVVNLRSMFQITNDGYLIYTPQPMSASSETFDIRVQVTNTEARSQQTEKSSILQLSITVSDYFDECFLLNCGNSTNTTKLELTNVAAVVSLGCLLIIALPVIITLVILVRRYKSEKKMFSKHPLVISQAKSKDYQGIGFFNMSHGENTSSASQNSVFSDVGTPNNLLKSSIQKPMTHLHKNLKNQLSKNSNNSIETFHNPLSNTTLDEPTIAPYDIVGNNTPSGNNSVKRSAAQPITWDKFNIKSTVKFENILIEEVLENSTSRTKSIGSMMRANNTSMPVIVYTYQDTYGSKLCLSDDLSAASEILHYKMCDHENIVKYYGCCVNNKTLYALYEHQNTRDLRTALCNSRMPDHAAVISSFSGTQLMNFVIGISSAISYLHSNGVVFGQLQCKNIRLTDQLIPKIQGCCGRRKLRQKYKSSRWLAPEVLNSRNYNKKAEIWAFAVVTWEILTLGGIPYPEISEKNVVRHMKEFPKAEKTTFHVCRNACKRLWSLLVLCWSNDASTRPTAAELLKKLQAIADSTTAITVARSPGYTFAPTCEI